MHGTVGAPPNIIACMKENGQHKKINMLQKQNQLQLYVPFLWSWPFKKMGVKGKKRCREWFKYLGFLYLKKTTKKTLNILFLWMFWLVLFLCNHSQRTNLPKTNGDKSSMLWHTKVLDLVSFFSFFPHRDYFCSRLWFHHGLKTTEDSAKKYAMCEKRKRCLLFLYRNRDHWGHNTALHLHKTLPSSSLLQGFKEICALEHNTLSNTILSLIHCFVTVSVPLLIHLLAHSTTTAASPTCSQTLPFIVSFSTST